MSTIELLPDDPSGAPTTPRAGVTGADLIEQRRRAGLTQQALADRFGCHKSTICRWERGHQQLRLEDAERLMALLMAAGEDREARQIRLREQVNTLRALSYR